MRSDLPICDNCGNIYHGKCHFCGHINKLKTIQDIVDVETENGDQEIEITITKKRSIKDMIFNLFKRT